MKHLITIAFALLAGAVWSQDYNYSVKVDSNGVLRTPTGFIPSNNIATVTAMNASNAAQDSAVSASNAVQDASIGSKVSTNDAAYLSGLTNGVGSGATVTITGRTFYVSVATDTNSAASVQADLDDHKTNVTAHSGLFDSYGSAIAVSNAYTNASALALTALQPASTQSWEVGSHASFATNTDPRLALAATALQPDGMGSNLVAYVYDPIGSIDTTKLTVSGAGNTAVDGTYTWDADWPYTDSIAGATNGAFVQSTSNYFIGRWYGCSSAWVLSTNGGFAETGTEYDTPYDGDPLSPTNGWVANAGPAPAPSVVFYGTPQVYRVSRVAELALDAYPRNNPSGFVTSATGISDATASNIAAGVVAASNLITLAQAAVLTNALVTTNDTRLSDARTPLSHSQPASSITNAPWITDTGITALTNGAASGTNMTGSIFQNGLAWNVGTNTPWLNMGAVTNLVLTNAAPMYSTLNGGKLYLGTNDDDSAYWSKGDSVTNCFVAPVKNATTLTTPQGTGIVTSATMFWNLGTLASNVVITVDGTMTNETQYRGFFLSWNPGTNSITFPTTVFTNYSTFTTGKVWNSYWVSGPGQTLFSGGGK